MWRQLCFVLPLILSTLAIRVPVDKEENATEIAPTKTAEKKQDTFYVSDEAEIDSYLIPPDPHRQEEVLSDIIITPATYLLPPSPEKQIDYYAPTEAGEQTDWYPIAQAPLPSTLVNLLPQRPPDVFPIFLANNQTFEIIQNPRGGKAYDGEQILIPLPSRQLQPPLEIAQNDYSIEIPSEELELPSEEVQQEFDAPHPTEYLVPIPKPNRKLKPKKNNLRFNPAEPTLALHLTPPKPLKSKHKNPTKLYPKKVANGFHPIPIPIAQFAEEPLEIPRAKPINVFNPVTSVENDYYTPDEKKVYLYEQAEQKRKHKGEKDAVQQQQLVGTPNAYGNNAPAEPETSETNYRHPGRKVYPAPLRQAPPAPVAEQSNVPAPPPPGERTEFRMHGMKGPHSYQFGFDTGKGKNRQFRYEERDNEGRVKGHYGYMDRSGKMRVVNYDADPEHGFHAEAPVESKR